MVTLDDPTSSSAAGIAIKKRVDNIKVSSSRAACISEADVPEDALLHYYEILLDKGEASAQDFLSEFTKQKQDKN